MKDPNYPDNIRDYDDDPRSPFYKPKWEDSDERVDAIYDAIVDYPVTDGLDGVFEASGPDAWFDHNERVLKIHRAICDDNAEELMNLMREPYMEYLEKLVAERVDAINDRE